MENLRFSEVSLPAPSGYLNPPHTFAHDLLVIGTPFILQHPWLYVGRVHHPLRALGLF